MNKENQDFLAKNKKLFKGRNICVGGLDVNGSISHIVKIKESIDIRDGQDVTKVLDACDMVGEYGVESFDGIICLNTLEHMEKWDVAMWNMYQCLKVGGHMILTTCTNHKARHNYPNDYWRFTLRELQGMFTDVVDSMCHPRPNQNIVIWIGVVIKKTRDDINLDFHPEAVE